MVLGVPIVAMQMVQMLINVTDTIMLGWLGVEELAAGTLAFQLLFLVLIFGIGFASALMPLIAGALGRNDPRDVRRAARMGIWALMLVSLLFMAPLFYTEDILLALGQEPQLAALAQEYTVYAQWSLVPAFLHLGLRNFMVSIERTSEVFWLTVFAALLNALLNYMLIFGNFGAPRLEMAGAGIATLLANATTAVLMVLIIWRSRHTRDYQVFARLWRPDWPAFRRIFALGVPISLTILAEAGLFSAASIMMGWISTIALAAHGIALQLASLAFMVPMGLAQAATVRVGRAAGEGNRTNVGLAGFSAIWMAVAFSVVSGIVFVVAPDPLVGLFLDSGKDNALSVLAYAVPLMWMAAAFQLVDGLQAVAAGALRGLSDTAVPMVIATISYWPVGVTSAYILAFHFGFGGVGIWGGLALGLACASVLLTQRFVRRERLGIVPDEIG